VFSVRKPSAADLAAMAREQATNGSFSYPEVGATATSLPPGYHHDRWQTDLGVDDGDRFDRAVAALRHWRPQRGAGFQIIPDVAVEPGLSFVLVLHLGPTYVTAGGRVVYVSVEANRYAFANGTLDSHPEQGEEAFAVVRDAGRVTFEIVAFSRPRVLLARVGSPITRHFQLRATKAYLEAMRSAAI
jgi:uncharacterized protein (UPF0548 family)